MPRNDNEDRADFMARHQLSHASWDQDGNLIAATRSTTAAARPAQPAAPQGPAAKLASAFADKLKREHETRFAASHFKPRLDVPPVTDNVPRAVRDREAERGAPHKSKRR